MEITQVLSNIKKLIDIGRFDKALKNIKEAKEHFNDEVSLFEFQMLIAKIKRFQSEFDDSIDQRLIDRAKKLGEKELQAKAIIEYTYPMWGSGKLIVALKTLEQEEPVFKMIEDQETKATFYNLKGVIYHQKGELNLALDNYVQSLEIRKKLENRLLIAQVLGNIGEVYLHKGELEKAKEYLTKCLEIMRKLDNPLYHAHFLLPMFNLYISSNNMIKAKVVVDEINVINEKNIDNLPITFIYQLSKALLFKSGNRLREKMKAEEILAKLVYMDDVGGATYQFRGTAIKHYCELLLIELKSLGDPQALEEAKDVVSLLQEIAQKQHSYSLIVEALILKSKFALLEGNLDQANMFLEQALMTTQENGLTQLQTQINREKQLMNSQMEKWKDFVDSNPTITDRIEQSKILDYLKVAQKMSF